jgi:hypothetical protein
MAEFQDSGVAAPANREYAQAQYGHKKSPGMRTDTFTATPKAAESSYELSFAAKQQILIVNVKGEINDQTARFECWGRIAEHARNSGLRRLMVIDRRQSRPATPEEISELTQFCYGQDMYYDRLALVVSLSVFLPAIEHVEIQAQSIGLNIRVFPDEGSAERWLLFGSAESDGVG